MSERSEAPWTPGPWQIEGVQIKHARQAGPGLYYVTNVATVETEWIYDGDYEANARLIAEAPAMAEALEWFATELRAIDGALSQEAKDRIRQAESILARVRGEEAT